MPPAAMQGMDAPMMQAMPPEAMGGIPNAMEAMPPEAMGSMGPMHMGYATGSDGWHGANAYGSDAAGSDGRNGPNAYGDVPT